jgi:hypothetical protein
LHKHKGGDDTKACSIGEFVAGFGLGQKTNLPGKGNDALFGLKALSRRVHHFQADVCRDHCK